MNLRVWLIFLLFPAVALSWGTTNKLSTLTGIKMGVAIGIIIGFLAGWFCYHYIVLLAAKKKQNLQDANDAFLEGHGDGLSDDDDARPFGEAPQHFTQREVNKSARNSPEYLAYLADANAKIQSKSG